MNVSIIDELRAGQFHPVYLLYGEEDYIVEKIIEVMKSTMLHSEWLEFNLSTYDLLKQSIDEVLDEVESFPFGEGRKLILAKNAYFLTGSTIKSSIEHSIDKLLTYLDHPTLFSTLVLIVPIGKLDERKKIVKELLKKSKSVLLQPLSYEQIKDWVLNRIEEKGILINTNSLEVLFRYLPHNLRTIEQELEKLSLYGEGKVISTEELKRIITRTVEGDVFSLIEKIVNRDFQGGYEIYEQLIKQNEEPIKLLALFARQFRIILQAKVLSSQGYTQKQIATQLKLHPYPVKLAIAQGEHFTEENLMNILHTLAQLDYQIKTGQMDKKLALELLLLQIQ